MIKTVLKNVQILNHLINKEKAKLSQRDERVPIRGRDRKPKDHIHYHMTKIYGRLTKENMDL